MNSPITNCWKQAATVRLDNDERVLHQACPGMSYHHHQHIIAVDGALYASFSSGQTNEDDVGQCVMFAASTDSGATWTEPRCIVRPPTGKCADAVATATGLHSFSPRDGAPRLLVAHYGQYEYDREGIENGRRKPADARHINTTWLAVTSADGGLSWSQPIEMLRGFVANLGPQRTRSGRLIMPGGSLYPYTDDPTGLAGWTRTGLPGLPPGHVDDSEGFSKAWSMDRERLGYCEGSMFQTDDGVIHMMLRTNREYLAVTESQDNGAHWGAVLPTGFSDNSSRHQFGRLPDGRYFALSTPRPDNQWQRSPLVLAISEDGIRFDRHFVIGDAPNHPPRIPGMHKGGRYGYPHLAIANDTVVVLYSIAKEDVAIRRFPLAALR